MQHRTLIHSTMALAVLALAIASCKAPTTSLAPSALGTVDAVSASQSAGAVRVRLHLPGRGGYAVKAMPTAWATADVSLYSSSVNAEFDDELHQEQVASDAFVADPGVPGAVTADVSFPPLRPAGDYTAQVFLRDAAGRLVGSLVQENVALKPGGNVIDLTVTLNALATQASLQDGTGVASNTITWAGPGNALAATVLTGIANSLPGVAKVEVSLSGESYDAAGSLLATLTNAETWQSFIWNLDSRTGTFNPTKIVLDKNGTLTIKAYNARGAVIGNSTVSIRIDQSAPSDPCPPGPGDMNGDCVPDIPVDPCPPGPGDMDGDCVPDVPVDPCPPGPGDMDGDCVPDVPVDCGPAFGDYDWDCIPDGIIIEP